MQKIFYLLHLLCLVFALQTTAAEPAVTTSLLQTSATATILSNAVDDVLTADFGDLSGCIDMLEIAEVDVDKIILPAFSYPAHRSSDHVPPHQLADYHPLFAFWLDRPPQIH